MGDVATSAHTVRYEVAELLGVDADAVDPDADLIASGLDSIRMMSLSGRWRKQGIDVGFAILAANPTVSAWARLVAEHVPGTEPEPEPALDDPSQPFPLAPIQHALWVGRNTEQELGGVAPHLYVEFDGAGVDPDRLGIAAAKLAARHPMLRVEILPDGTQRIGDRSLPIQVFDLRSLTVDDAEQRLEDIRETKSHQLLDDEALELALSLLPDGRTRLHVDLDMKAADAVSYRNFMADLAAFYRGVDLPELGYSYRQYRAAYTAAHTGPTDEDRAWWAARVPDLPEPPALPLVPRAERQNPLRNIRRWHVLDVATRDALFAKAHQRGITPAMAVAASYSHALARWSSSPRFMLNLPMFGREPFHADVDKLVGDFTSSLMLDIDLTDTTTAAERAKSVQETLHNTARHSSYAGLSVLRDLTRHRGTQTLAPFVFTSALGLGDLFAGDVTDQFGTPVWTISQGPQVLLDAQATPLVEGLMINWDIRVDAFRPGVIEAMFAYHIDELQRLAADDDAWDAIDPPAVPAGQRSLRAEVNSVTAEPSGDALQDGFFRAAAKTPDAPAVFSSLGDWTYAELREQVLAVAAGLHYYGVGTGDVVAVMGPKNAEQIPALLGILAAGAVYLPVGVDQPADRAARILDTADVTLVLVCGPGIEGLAVPSVTVAEAIDRGDHIDIDPAATDPRAVSHILFTSGSTGEPKGVEITHDAAMNTVEFIHRHFEIGSGDRILALSTLECDLSVLDIFGTLSVGASIVVVDETERRNPDSWAAQIAEYGVTVLHFMPGWLEMLLAIDGELSSVRVVPTGGDWVRPDMVRELRRRAPRVRFAGLCGATETATHSTIFEVSELPAHWTSVPLGKPLPNNACRVVGAGGHDCPDWVPGELWVSGRGTARGYRGRRDLTAARFVEHEGRTWYRTGDLVRYLPSGDLEFVGRADHRIKVSGYRIELGDVEAALMRVPGVDAAVAAVLTTDAQRPLLAALIRTGSVAVDTQSVSAAMAELVPAYMIPQLIEVTDTTPFTIGGKIDRAEVARQLADVDVVVEYNYRAPSSRLELALTRIVGEVLGADEIGVDDDFFSVGGDSVLATQAVGRVRTWLDIPSVMVADIFAARTVAALAAKLTERETEPGRLELVAEVYLEVADMEAADVSSALETATAGP